MAKKGYNKLTIPRRSRHCQRSKAKFMPGDEYISLLREDDEGDLLREDILFSVWKEEKCDSLLEGSKSHWVAKIPEKKISVSLDSEEMLENGYDLLLSYLKEATDETALRAFILALFLARKKKLLFRQEMQHEDNLMYLFEDKDTEEMICVKTFQPSEEEIASIQHELKNEINALS